MKKEHTYTTQLIWTGNRGPGTTGYQAYDRSYDLQGEGKPVLHGSADPAFLGDPLRYNPEELLVASVAACHMLWYLHLCATQQVVVLGYEDHPEGLMREDARGSAAFVSIELRPKVTVSDSSMVEAAQQLHQQANALCFIAKSLNFQVHHAPEIMVAQPG